MTRQQEITAIDVRVQHRIYQDTMRQMTEQISLSMSLGGAVVPLLGPTRCGKTEILADLRRELEEFAPGPGSLISTSSFGLGTVPPKPNDRDLYRSMLLAIGYDCGPKERTGLVRERLISLIKDDGVKIIALDEASHCAEPGANLSPRAATDHFKAIVDATGITLILSGLPKFQKLIDDNEQLRERSLSTVIFPPYAWASERDRDDFTAAILSIFEHLLAQGVRQEFDDLDMVRRIYGASGGRVGLSSRLLTASLMLNSDEPLTLSEIRRGAESTLQAALRASVYFQPEPPTDLQLVRSYAAVMKDADLPLVPGTLDELEAFGFGIAR